MKPLLSIRRLSRFGYPIFIWAAWLVWVSTAFGRFNPRIETLSGVLLFGVATATYIFAFRCPRCRRSTLTESGHWFDVCVAPLWTPPVCRRCALDFRGTTFWSPENAARRADWVASRQPKGSN